jgi:arylsulfatase A-like enzyme
MSFSLGRREFLKLLSFLPLALTSSSQENRAGRFPMRDADSPNVLILIFDALSAQHVSLYGYNRNTMPNLARFAERATVYHSHFSGGNFTIPGTASLLTGTYPWTHRAYQLRSTVHKPLADRNIFNAFSGKPYTRLGFSHNQQTNFLLHQFRHDMEDFIMPKEIALLETEYSDALFFNDYDVAAVSEITYLRPAKDMPLSLFLYWILQFFEGNRKMEITESVKDLYPKGPLANREIVYLLEDTIDWMIHKLASLPQPYLSYVHLWPPHYPYRPRRDFINSFEDGWEPIEKPQHPLSNKTKQDVLNNYRQDYDEFLAYADSEFGRLYDSLESQGMLDNTLFVFTSDHGEMFERGIWAHTTSTLFDPIIRVPLLISKPGQTQREDVYTPNSSIDILPTLLQLTGQQIPDWCEGTILPPFNGSGYDADRSIYVVEAKKNSKFRPLENATIAMVKGDYKLVYYFGYEEYDGVFELYDLANDPEELEDLYTVRTSTASTMEDELRAKLEEVNAPYES